MSDVTRILSQIQTGDATAADQLLPLVYNELRKLAAARMADEVADHTLQPTALVHEAYIRLVDDKAASEWNSRGHFFGAAAEAMRRILIEHARRNRRQKRGGDWRRVNLDDADLAQHVTPEQLLDLDELVDRLAGENPSLAGLVKLRFFAGLSFEEAAAALDLSTATAYRHWSYARAWLRCELLRNER